MKNKNIVIYYTEKEQIDILKRKCPMCSQDLNVYASGLIKNRFIYYCRCGYNESKKFPKGWNIKYPIKRQWYIRIWVKILKLYTGRR